MMKMHGKPPFTHIPYHTIPITISIIKWIIYYYYYYSFGAMFAITVIVVYVCIVRFNWLLCSMPIPTRKQPKNKIDHEWTKKFSHWFLKLLEQMETVVGHIASVKIQLAICSMYQFNVKKHSCIHIELFFFLFRFSALLLLHLTHSIWLNFVFLDNSERFVLCMHKLTIYPYNSYWHWFLCALLLLLFCVVSLSLSLFIPHSGQFIASVIY